MLLQRILARYKKKNVLHSRATEVIFRRSRSLKGERPRVADRRKTKALAACTRELDQKKLFFLIDDTS